MAVTEVEICNSALAKVGAARILTLDDDSEEARLCKTLFYRLRDKLLRSHPWRFATRRVALGPLVTAPIYEFQNAFQLPNDCLRVLAIDGNDSEEWKEESGQLLCNLDSVNIKYIWKNEDTSSYDSNFVEVLAFDLAVELCMPLAQNATLRATLVDERKLALREARSFNAQVGSVDRVKADTWLNARF